MQQCTTQNFKTEHPASCDTPVKRNQNVLLLIYQKDLYTLCVTCMYIINLKSLAIQYKYTFKLVSVNVARKDFKDFEKGIKANSHSVPDRSISHYRGVPQRESESSFCWNCRTRLEKRYHKKLETQKQRRASIQNYVASNKIKTENIVTADEWKLVCLLNELLEPFYKVTQQCSKNNALLSSIISHAAVIKKFIFIKRLIVNQVKVALCSSQG